jgi:hypothetical protein
VLQRAHAFMARHANLIITLLLIYVAIASLLQAMNRAFWFDEVFTVVIARLGSMSDVWQALASAGDTSPPGFYVLQRFLSGLVGNEQIGYRLISILSVPLTSLFLYLFMRRDTDPVAACVAAVLPLLTVLYSTFSVEARAYAPMACMLAITAFAWQHASRKLGSVVLALALIAAVSIHYYAIFALLPLAAAELTWSAFNRRVRPGVWLAIVAGGLSCVAYWPLLNNLRQVYGRHYWAKASVFRAITSYDEYLSVMTLGATLGFVAVLSGALLVYVIRTVRPRPEDPIPPDVPPPNCVLALGLLWLPWIALVAAQVAGGGIAARYTIGAALGIALSAGYVAYWLGQRASAVLLMCLLTAFLCKEAVFWGAELAGRNTRRVDVERFHALIDRGQPSEPVVVTNGMDFVPLAFYAPPDLTKRLVALLDPESARQHTGTDSIELDLLVLKKYMPINVQTYEDFEAAHDRFLLYASPGHGDWWQERLLRDGMVLTTIAAEGSRVLYRVDKKN